MIGREGEVDMSDLRVLIHNKRSKRGDVKGSFSHLDGKDVKQVV